jgi:hypothetical protein
VGLSHSPVITTDGLILCLDAANPRSYALSGDNWNDLSGNGNNGTLINGPVFDSENGGSIVFDGTNDVFYTSKTASEIGVSEESMTLFMFIKRSVHPTSQANGHAGFSVGSSQITIKNTTNFFVDVYNDGTRLSGTNVLLSAASYYDKWINLCFTIDNGVIRGYGNGSFTYTRTLTLPSIASAQFSIAGGYGYYRLSGSVGSCYLYNRPLSAYEIAQNYNVMKGRFGL